MHARMLMIMLVGQNERSKMLHYARVAMLALLAPVAVLSDPAYASYDDQFVCSGMGDGDFTVTMSSDDSRNASVQYAINGYDADASTSEPVALRRMPSGSGILYAGLGYIFRAKGYVGTLEVESGSVTCRFAGEGEADDGETDAAAEMQSIDIAARSWGGKVRAGPGMAYDATTSLAEGDPVTVLVNTGVEMNGYEWFFIRLSDGSEGYQWGGILCTELPVVAGTFSEGKCPIR